MIIMKMIAVLNLEVSKEGIPIKKIILKLWKRKIMAVIISVTITTYTAILEIFLYKTHYYEINLLGSMEYLTQESRNTVIPMTWQMNQIPKDFINLFMLKVV